MKPTMEQVLARCTVDGEHVLWSGSTFGAEKKRPRWRVGKNECYNLRRLAYEAYHGVELASHTRIGSCDNPMCIARGCLHIASRAESARKGHAREEAKARRREANQRSGRAARVLSPEQAKLAKTSQQSLTHVAKFLNCSRELVSAIRNRRRYADVT